MFVSLTIFFSMNTKEAAVNSIITILFSQASKLVTVAASSGFSGFDLSILRFMVLVKNPRRNNRL